jgi:hypothetical protein
MGDIKGMIDPGNAAQTKPLPPQKLLNSLPKALKGILVQPVTPEGGRVE